jgi:hypothetical protein
MNKVINGKMYDSDTATRITDIDTEDKYSRLYKKTNGEFFVRWEYRNGKAPFGTTDETEHITPLTDKQGRNLAERLLSGSEYETKLGEVAE